MSYVYELRDVSDKNKHYRLGLFDSIDDAKNIVDSKDKQGEAVSIFHELYDEDYETISIVRLSKGGYGTNEKDMMFFHREFDNDAFKTYEVQDYRSVIK